MKKNILLTIIMTSMAAAPSFAGPKKKRINTLNARIAATDKTVAPINNAAEAIDKKKEAVGEFLALANADEKSKTLVQIEADTMVLRNANPQWNNMNTEQLEGEAKALTEQSASVKTNIASADQELDQLNSQIKTRETEIAELNKKLEPGQKKVTELTKDIDALNEKLGKTSS